MYCGILFAIFFPTIFLTKAEMVDIVGNETLEWGAPMRVGRCPMHKHFGIRRASGQGVWLTPAGDGKFSVAEVELPLAAKLPNSTGLIISYTALTGAEGVSLWRIRVSSAADPTTRFTHLFSVPADGVANETRYMPWADFHGQLLKDKAITDCRDAGITDARCTLNPDTITHVSFLESEDTVAHAILVHSVIVTTDPIQERNVEQHHTEEQAALIWEQEHKRHFQQDIEYNGTHYLWGGNCEGLCIRNMTTSILANVTIFAAVSSAFRGPLYVSVAIIGTVAGCICSMMN
eukprot:TRINITY_DN71534_c0_g1_i1.p2 TRINITY_DN71534_c0_g1~~TRINITY_DN71534_c0_g1_i1.p2  ORF type:complete len:290 (-),score=28.71 TRINITY_DN71534_c0_g1_i1:166-1035(-)